MKILVLMPCDEQHVYMAAGIYKNLSQEVKDVTFAIPQFMDYLINGKIVGNWVLSLLDGLKTAENLYLTAEKEDKDIIIIGNTSKESDFDAIFSFQDNEQELPYKDNFINKVKQIIKANENEENSKEVKHIYSLLDNLYSAEDSEMNLMNCKAAAKFLDSYMKSSNEQKLKELKEQYKKVIELYDTSLRLKSKRKKENVKRQDTKS